MPKRKAAELLDGARRREVLLCGISDRAAVQLYDEGMAQLEEQGQATYAAAVQMSDAAQWTVTINAIQDALTRAVRMSDRGERRIAQLIRHKQAAEDARRRILDGLLLTPQRPLGRPPRQAAESALPAADDGWDSFGKSVSADRFGDGDDDP